jgi:hypothetical protein
VFGGEDAVKLLRLIRPFVHHPLRRLRIELILVYHDGRISREEFKRLYNMTKYKRGRPDIKRNNALEALARTAPQTHTHGGLAVASPEAYCLHPPLLGGSSYSLHRSGLYPSSEFHGLRNDVEANAKPNHLNRIRQTMSTAFLSQFQP